MSMPIWSIGENGEVENMPGPIRHTRVTRGLEVAIRESGVSAEGAGENLRRAAAAMPPDPHIAQQEGATTDKPSLWRRIARWLRVLATEVPNGATKEYEAGYREATYLVAQHGLDAILPSSGKSVDYIVGASRARRDLRERARQWAGARVWELELELATARATSVEVARIYEHLGLDRPLPSSGTSLSEEQVEALVAELRAHVARDRPPPETYNEPVQAVAPQRRMFRRSNGNGAGNGDH